MIRSILATLVALGQAGPGGNVQQTPSAPSAVVLPRRVGVEAASPRPLTLEDAIRLTLEENNDVSIARLELQSAREDIRAAEGIYDPVLVPSLSYQRTISASASAIGGAVNGRLQTNQVLGTMELAGRTPWAGGRFTVDFSSLRTETSNQFARLNPQYPSSLGATYTQPLFRGRLVDADRRQILLARRAVDLTDAQLTQVLMDQLTLVEQAYWDLVFAARNLEVQTTAMAQAQNQVASNERQVREGTLAPIDVVEAQTQVANFRQSVASAQQMLTEAENRLKVLIAANRHAEVWNQALQPAAREDRPVPTASLQDAVQLALTRRPELAALESTRAQNEIDTRFFQDQAKPQVDLVGVYSLAGLAGGSLSSSANPPVGGGDSDEALRTRLNELSLLAGLAPLETPPSSGNNVPEFLVGSYNRSLSNLISRRFPTAQVQLQIELPFANTTARANLARARLAGTQISRRRQQLEQSIEAEVRNTLQAVHSSQHRLEAAASARRNASEQYESERRRFDSGLSTVFLVLERQTALVAAQGQELRSRADLNQAIAMFDRAVGGTLEQYGVTLTRQSLGNGRWEGRTRQ